jgi:hypothetical protein
MTVVTERRANNRMQRTVSCAARRIIVVHTNTVSFFHVFSGVNWPKLRNDVLMYDKYEL